MIRFCFFTLAFLLLGVAHARLDSLVVFSPAMQKNIPVWVLVPDQAPNGISFPSVYLLHGYSGNQRQWAKDAPGLQAQANQYGQILVMPDGGHGSWYLDSPRDSSYRYETFFTQELVPAIDQLYPTQKSPTARAITGLSMGGHGAWWLSWRHPEIWGAAGSICGGMDIRPFPKNWDLSKVLGDFSSFRENWDKHTVLELVRNEKYNGQALLFDCGTDDFFLSVNRSLHASLLQLKIPHVYTEQPGTHNAAYWGQAIQYHLLFFDQFFKKKKA